MKPIRVFIIGPPASGKSTARLYLEEYLRDMNMDFCSIGIDEAHRELSLAGNCSDQYRIEDDGSLVLLNREVQIPLAVDWLVKWADSQQSSFLLELAHDNVVEALELFNVHVVRHSLLLHVTAPVDLRIERNTKRGESRVPPEIVRSYPDSLRSDEITRLLSLGFVIDYVETSTNLEATKNDVAFKIRKYLFANCSNDE